MRDVWNDAVIAEIVDLMVYQSVIKPQFERDNVLAGAEFVMIDPAYAGLTPNFDGPIVVSLGGSDPHGMALRVIESLAGIDRQIIVVNGAAADEVNLPEGVTFVSAPDSLVPYLDGASLLIGALGMTAYEAAAAGVPSLLTAWSEDHQATSLELENRSVCFSLGTWDNFSGEDLKLSADGLLGNHERWQSMSAAGKSLVDGQGVKRVADRLVALIDGGASEVVAEPETTKRKRKAKTE